MGNEFYSENSMPDDPVKGYILDKIVEFLQKRISPTDWARVENEIDNELYILETNIYEMAAELNDLITTAAEYHADLDNWFKRLAKVLGGAKIMNENTTIIKDLAKRLDIPKRVLVPSENLMESNFSQLAITLANIIEQTKAARAEVISERAKVRR